MLPYNFPLGHMRVLLIDDITLFRFSSSRRSSAFDDTALLMHWLGHATRLTKYYYIQKYVGIGFLEEIFRLGILIFYFVAFLLFSQRYQLCML